MCGIAGFIDFRQQTPEERLKETAFRMVNAIRHRGPDDLGTWVDERSGVALGHCRLAIIDLSPTGRQPMVSPSGRYVITFNGEIYNFRDLRDELKSSLSGASLRLRGTSDTEVMLAAFDVWGIERSVAKFNGMFAFAVWDTVECTLTLGRDRFGKKPLYYGKIRDTFFFGSELKALRMHPEFVGEIDPAALDQFLQHNYVPSPYSIFRHVNKLVPGATLTVRPKTRSIGQPISFWSISGMIREQKANPFRGSESEAVEELDRLLTDAVGLRMIADVPLGVFLSGGIDSSLVAALVQAQSGKPIETFTVGFQEAAYNEAEYAEAVARHLHTAHSELYVSPSQAMDVIPSLPEMFDEPFADSSQIPTFLVSQFARRHVTVCLSGDGGDELFGGYGHHIYGPVLWSVIRHIPEGMRNALANFLEGSGRGVESLAAAVKFVVRSKRRLDARRQVNRLAELIRSKDPEDLYWNVMGHWRPAPCETSVGAGDCRSWKELGSLQNISLSERMMFLDLATYLIDNNLVKMDRASMSVALEVRNPLLDYRVAEFGWSLPVSMKIQKRQGKWLLRRVLEKYLPVELFDRPKAGFSIPLDSWLRGPMRSWAESLLEPKRIREQGLLDYTRINEAWKAHISGRENKPYPLWGVLMFQAWMDFRAVKAATSDTNLLSDTKIAADIPPKKSFPQSPASDAGEAPVYVFRTGQLGDSLVALPAVHAIKEAFPERPIILVGDVVPGEQYLPSWEVFRLSGVFSDAMSYTPMNRSRLSCLSGLFAIAKEMRRFEKSPLFYLVNDGAPAPMIKRHRFFFERLCEAQVVGIDDALRPYKDADGNGRLVPRTAEHQRLFDIVQSHVDRPLTFRTEGLLHIDESARIPVEHYFRDTPLRDFVAFGPWSKMPCKRWPLERYAEVGKFLVKAKGMFPVILGSANERAIGETLLKEWDGLGLNLCGITISESAEALRRCVLYVGNDTGTMHLAAAAGVKCVGIFSSRDAPGRWNPIGEGHVILRHRVPCEGCMLETCRFKVIHCLDGLSVEQITEGALKILEETAGSSRTRSIGIA
jgi:asparagine synthase (glutamine-hydrolysing)